MVQFHYCKRRLENHVTLEQRHCSAQMCEARDQHNWGNQWLCGKEHDNILRLQNGIFKKNHDEKEKKEESHIIIENKKARISLPLFLSHLMTQSLELNLLYM